MEVFNTTVPVLQKVIILVLRTSFAVLDKACFQFICLWRISSEIMCERWILPMSRYTSALL